MLKRSRTVVTDVRGGRDGVAERDDGDDLRTTIDEMNLALDKLSRNVKQLRDEMRSSMTLLSSLQASIVRHLTVGAQQYNRDRQ